MLLDAASLSWKKANNKIKRTVQDILWEIFHLFVALVQVIEIATGSAKQHNDC